jgi:ArsR family transcriptional regulator
MMKEALKIFKALSDPTRLRIVSLLLRRELCVCELMFILKMEQSRISHQLRILKDADLVEDTRDGRWIIYRVPSESRKGFELLLDKFLGPELEKSAVLAEDLAGLDQCLKQDVRRRQSSSSPWLRREP